MHFDYYSMDQDKLEGEWIEKHPEREEIVEDIIRFYSAVRSFEKGKPPPDAVSEVWKHILGAIHKLSIKTK